MKKKLLIGLASAVLLSIAACGEEAKPTPRPTPTPAPDYVPIFVLSGQSNMEGSSNWRLNGQNLLKECMEELGEDYSYLDPDETNNTIDQKEERNDVRNNNDNILLLHKQLYHFQ